MTEHVDDNLVGRTIGEFVLRERIGEGGFGAVYRAIQPALDREAVIKVLHTRLGATHLGTERFLREAKLASKLDHPYAAHIYAFGAESDGERWIAMELVRGTPLDQILRIQGPLPLERFVPLLERICEVVHTAHEQGIVHRDIKPANVMVISRAGIMLPKLLDFGIAKGLERDGDVGRGGTLPAITTDAYADEFAHTLGTNEAALTQRGALIGSPPYMAPEQWLDAGTVDGRTDLYALGILAYEALTGATPFTSTTITGFAKAHAMDSPPALGARFPGALDAVIAKVLAKAPGDRYADALTFAKAFRQAAGLGAEPTALPGLDAARRAAVATRAPQPIADAAAVLESARNVHQARDALLLLVRAIVRYVGLLALASRSRFRVGADSATASELMRTLYRRSLGDAEWIELTRQLVQAWASQRDAHPIPELVDAFAGDGLVQDLEALASLRGFEAVAEDVLREELQIGIERVGRVLGALAFVDDYTLAVAGTHGVAERWMGANRVSRGTVLIRGHSVAAGTPVVLDGAGVPVLTLAPLFAVAPPSAGAPLELFLFEGRGERGARLVTLPSGFAIHDDALWDWFRLQLVGTSAETLAATADERPPYRGLSAFSAEDGTLFVGREMQVDAFVNRLRVQTLLAVVGRSGAGKSSFVQAGVIPALGWRAITMRPGSSPFGTLTARLASAGIERAQDVRRSRERLGQMLRADAATRGPIVLVIDQLEELFTLGADTAEREAFADCIATAARAIEDPVRVIFTLRDDFLLRAEQITALRSRIGQGLQLLAVPAPEDLLRILVEPAKRVGYEFDDPRLPLEMVKDVADQPGTLALLSFTASRLWELRDRHFKQLTRASYETLGGVGGALAKHAEHTLDEMPVEERGLVREAFRHLVTTQNTRAVLERRELRQLLGDTAHADGVVEKLVAARLLVASEHESGAETIEVVHEALLVAWPRLVEWRREDVEGARFHEQLRGAAKQWDERGRPKGLLWRGDALADYTRWRGKHGSRLTELESAFGDAGVREAASANRLRRGLLAGAFAVLAAGLVVAFTLNARANAERRRVAELQVAAEDGRRRGLEEQGRKAFLAGDPISALLYVDAASRAGADNPTLHYLRNRTVALLDKKQHTLRQPTAVRQVRVNAGRVFTIGGDGDVRTWKLDGSALASFTGHTGTIGAFELAGERMITGGTDGTARIWDTTRSKLMHVLRTDEAGLLVVRFDRDARSVLTSGANTPIRIWDVESGQLRVTVPATDTADAVLAFAGKAVFSLSYTHEVLRWDLAPAPRSTRVDRHPVGDVCAGCSLSSSPDGSVVASASEVGVVELWAGADGRRVAALDLKLDRVAKRTVFDAAGRRLAIPVGTEIQIWNVASFERVATMRGHQGDVTHVAFSHDGARVASASSDGSTRIWDVATGELLSLLPGLDAVVSATFTDDDKRVVLAAGPRTEIWDARADLHVRSLDLDQFVMSIALGKDGQVAACGSEGRVTVWRATERVIWDTAQPCLGVALSATNATLATAGADGATRLWRATSGEPIATLVSNKTGVQGVAFSPDERRIITADNDRVARVWDVTTRTIERTLGGHTSEVTSVAWSPDGAFQATCNLDATVRLWDRSGGDARVLKLGGGCYSVAFDGDGSRLVAAGRDAVRIWSSRDPTRTIELAGRHDKATAVFVSSDLVLTTSKDRTARLWDATTGRLVDVWEHPGLVDVIHARFGEPVTSYGDRLIVWRLPKPADPATARRITSELPLELRNDVPVRREVSN